MDIDRQEPDGDLSGAAGDLGALFLPVRADAAAAPAPRRRRPAAHPAPGLQIARGLLLAVATYLHVRRDQHRAAGRCLHDHLRRPLLVTALSVPLLKERVGWRRWSAVLVGFAGVLIVIRPGFGEVPWQLLLPLVTAACFALYQILTRLVSVDSRRDAVRDAVLRRLGRRRGR